MNVKVKKFLFLGPGDEKKEFFEKAQQQGIIQFIDSRTKAEKEVPEDIKRLGAAIKILRGLSPVEQEENYDILNADDIVNQILSLHERDEKLAEELRVLNLEIARVHIFGDFSLEDIQYIEKEGKRTVQFFCAKPTLFLDQPVPEGLIYAGSDHDLDYYVAINPHRVTYDKMIEIKIDRPLGVLEQRNKDAQLEKTEVEHRLKDYAKYNDFLHHALIDKLNQANLYTAQNYVQEAMGGSLFAVEGWVPANKIEDLHHLLDKTSIYADEVAIEPQDVMPTYLENKGASRIGEDLVHIYDTPSVNDKDPSLWVLSCFALFFAFIIGDAGYGLVYLIIALILRWKYPNLKGTAKRVLNLFTILCVGCIVWGTLMTSFFGVQIAPNSPIRKLSLVQWLAEKKAAYHIAHKDETYQSWIQKYPQLGEISDPHEFVSAILPTAQGESSEVLTRFVDNIMFEMAIFIGVVHLMLSFLRYAGRNWPNFGWVAFLLGAYLYFAYYLNAPSFLNFVGGIDLVRGGHVGFELMIAGLLVAWGGAIIVNGWKGIFEIMTVVQVFADTLSYLRLYALGLAGAIVSSTINEIASGIPLVFGVLLIILAHFINIVLGTMSGVIHGLRLNFLEWYHYSFEGGGQQFRPLKLLKKE